jgi:chorismate-pyruvate lyase
MKYMRLKHRLQFIINTQLDNLKSVMNRLGAMVVTDWHYINHCSICTIGKVLKINSIYTYKEDGNVDIVRLLDVYKDKGYLYCTLYFFRSNKIITVSQILQTDAYFIWRIMDNK